MSADDDETIQHQQNVDLGHAERDGLPPKIDGSVKGPIERLDRSVDSDGLLVGDDGDGLPDAEDEEARKQAVDKARAPSDPKRHRL